MRPSQASPLESQTAPLECAVAVYKKVFFIVCFPRLVFFYVLLLRFCEHRVLNLP